MINQDVTGEAAFIIHARSYRESSLLLEVFTRNHGRVGLVARGVKNSKSRHHAILQVFNYLSVSYKGKGELATLTDVELIKNFQPGSYGHTLCAFYINELMYRLLHKGIHFPQLFEQYTQTMFALQNQNDQQTLLRQFENQLLSALGYELNYEYCAQTGDPIAAQKYYQFLPETGFISAQAGQENTLLGASLLAFARGDELNDKAKRDIRSVLQIALRPLIGNKEFKSRALYLEYLRKRETVTSQVEHRTE